MITRLTNVNARRDATRLNVTRRVAYHPLPPGLLHPPFFRVLDTYKEPVRSVLEALRCPLNPPGCP